MLCVCLGVRRTVCVKEREEKRERSFIFKSFSQVFGLDPDRQGIEKRKPLRVWSALVRTDPRVLRSVGGHRSLCPYDDETKIGSPLPCTSVEG